MHRITDDQIKPIHGNSIYHITSFGLIWQSVFFDYYDPDHYYVELTHTKKKHTTEINRLWNNMQFFLEHEKILINNVRSQQKVVYVNYDHHGTEDYPYVYFLINILATLKPGKNLIQSYVIEEIAEYDFELVWCFPPNSIILDVDTKLEYEQIGSILNFWGRARELVGGNEAISFELNKNSF